MTVALRPLGEEDEIDVHADGHGGHRPVERVVQQEEAQHQREGDRHRAGVNDRQHRRGEQKADREHDDEGGEYERMCHRLGRSGADEHDAGPGDTVDGLDADQRRLPAADVDIGAREARKAVAHTHLHGAGEEDGSGPQHRLTGWRPEHRGECDDDGEQRDRQRRAELVAHEHRQQLVLELRLGDAGRQTLPHIGDAGLRALARAAYRAARSLR